MDESESKPAKAKPAIGRFRELNIIVALAILCLFFYIEQPGTFAKPANISVILHFIATFGMLGIGEVLVIITGGIDLSLGSLTALTGVLTALFMQKGIAGLPPIGMVPAILLVLGVGLLFGLWHGFLVTKLGIPPFIGTLGTWLAARGLANYITRGFPILFPTDSPVLVLGQGSVSFLPVSFLILLVFAVLLWVVLEKTPLGYRIFAVGGNIEAARMSGVDVDGVRLFCYASSGFLAALTGILLASRLGQGTPTVGVSYELWAIAAAVIGGTSLLGGVGSILGAILGAAIVGVMQNGMVLLNVSSYLQDVILGVVLVAAVIYDTLRRSGSTIKISNRLRKGGGAYRKEPG